jgi:hypothetical protein
MPGSCSIWEEDATFIWSEIFISAWWGTEYGYIYIYYLSFFFFFKEFLRILCSKIWFSICHCLKNVSHMRLPFGSKIWCSICNCLKNAGHIYTISVKTSKTSLELQLELNLKCCRTTLIQWFHSSLIQCGI